MIDRIYRKWYNNCRWLKCERAGTGRQARLRGVCLWRTGSSPVARTKWTGAGIWSSKVRQSRFRPLFLCYSPSVQAVSRGLSLFIEKGHRKGKTEKTGCKNNRIYLFWTGDSHFVEDIFWFWIIKFLSNGIRLADNNFVPVIHNENTIDIWTPQVWTAMVFCYN